MIVERDSRFRPMAEEPAKASNRAQRFPIHVPVRYRETGGRAWVEGKTENVSRSGVLLRAETVLSPKTAVEMRLTFQGVIKNKACCEILCKGVVVRKERSNSRSAPPALAVTIQQYQLLRGRQVN